MAQAAAAIGGSVISGLIGSIGAKKAAKAQAAAINAATQHQQNQFNQTQQEFSPYLNAGTGALTQIQDILGLGGSLHATGASPGDLASFLASVGDGKTGRRMKAWLQANPNATGDQQLAALQGLADPQEIEQFKAYQAANPYRPATSTGTPGDVQQQSIDALKASPAFTSLYNTGQDTIDQNAAATGGLRGGNTQNSLAQFGSSLLAQVIQQQLGNLGSLSGQGASLVSNLGQLGQQNANAQSNLSSQLGNANAVGAGAPYAALQGIISQLTGGGQASLGNFFGGGSQNKSVSAYGNNAINSMGLLPLNFN